MHLSISDDQILPTVFTPNQDGKNDLFSFDASSFGDFTLTLYNRWGQVVHVMKKGGKFWDGNTISGKPCSEGCYYYSMSTDWDEHITGYITLFR
jgi:gliding motility-associated-like protein